MSRAGARCTSSWSSYCHGDRRSFARTDDSYADEGGAHILVAVAVAEADTPSTPGLMLEAPNPLPPMSRADVQYLVRKSW